jgi:hypothetical protein
MSKSEQDFGQRLNTLLNRFVDATLSLAEGVVDQIEAEAATLKTDTEEATDAATDGADPTESD